MVSDLPIGSLEWKLSITGVPVLLATSPMVLLWPDLVMQQPVSLLGLGRLHSDKRRPHAHGQALLFVPQGSADAEEAITIGVNVGSIQELHVLGSRLRRSRFT